MPEVGLRLLTRDEVSMQVQPRTTRGKGPMGRLRREQGLVPGILYGHNQAPFAFQTVSRTLERLFARNGQSVLFRVEVEGQAEPPAHAIVRQVQYHKVSGLVLHLDLLRIDPQETRVITVPLHTTGVPEGVRTGGGALQHAVTSLDLECVISQMPAAIELDIQSLRIGDTIHVSDLLAQESRIVTDAGVAIVSVLAPRLTVDEEAGQAAAAEAEPEAATEQAEGKAEEK